MTMDHLHGKVIKFGNEKSLRKLIPGRDSFLDPKCVKETDKKIIDRGEILFLPNSVKEFHEKNDDNQLVYKILIFGITPDGRKAAVILEDIYPYFEVKKPEDITVNEFRKKMNNILSEGYRNASFEEISAKGFDKYSKEQSMYMRIYFTNLWERKKALSYFINTMEWETTTDDENHYERVVCRNNNFSFCSWNRITKFKSYKKEKICKPNAFRVSYKDFIKHDGDITSRGDLTYDKTIVETWDIEAYTNTGEIPNADNKDDVVFMIGQTYHWKFSYQPLLNVCLSSRPCDPVDDMLIILCKNEKELILASFVLHSIIMPDFRIGFNDGDFDWPFILKKATKYKILDDIKRLSSLFNDYKKSSTEDIIKWDCRKMRIKLEADTVAYSTTLTVPGCINIDVRTMFRKLFPTESKSSLKFYLELNNLGGKDDMPISELFNIYKTSIDIEEEIKEKTSTNNTEGINELIKKHKENTSKMSEVAHYCMIDAFRCQELMIKANIITDKREVSNVSHTTLYDALYFADGMKVRNLIIAEGQKRNILFSTRSKKYIGEGKYPGAYVFPPIKGVVKPKLSIDERCNKFDKWKKVPENDIKIMKDAIKNNKSPIFESRESKELFTEFIEEKNKYPVPGLDFSSLYPSIIMAFNLSPEYMVFDEESVKEREKEGHSTYKIDFMFNGERQIAWSIRHDTFDGKKLLPGKTENKFGLYPYILKNLFDKRSEMKKGMGVLAKQKEVLDKEKKQNTDEYAKICFNLNYINAKQKALKVFMNTFYGETGNKLSPFFVLAIAGGITSTGQRNIRMISDVVIKEGCKLYYGDTDSCYISCPDRYFEKFDRLYYSGEINKKEYCTNLVNETFKQIEVIKKIANQHLINDNGTGFLKMAYEEVLYPCMFLLKKMYAGVEHQHIVNFEPEPDKLFTKGLSLKRRGTSDVLKKVCTEILMESLDINSTSNLIDIVVGKIKEIYSREWKLEDFKKTAVYKPSKQNVSVLSFIERMRERNDPACPLPQPGERFEYVVVKTYPFKYDIKGRKLPIKVGDMWEYYSYAKSNNIGIDLDYYMSGGIIGQFAQFISYHNNFYVNPSDSTSDMYDIAEKKTLINAKKYIEAICNEMMGSPKCQGNIRKALFRIADKSCKKMIKTQVKDKEILNILSTYSSDMDLFTYIYDKLSKESKKNSSIVADVYVERMIKKYGKSIVYNLLKLFKSGSNSLLKYRIMTLASIEDKSRKQLMDNIYEFKNLFLTREEIIYNLIENLKDKLNLNEVLDNFSDCLPDHTEFESNNAISDIVNCTGEFNDKYSVKINGLKETIELFYDIYNNLLIVMSQLEDTKSIIERLQFIASSEKQENPIPPGLSVEDELVNALDFVRNNLIDF